MTKRARHAKILELIAQREIDRQEEIVIALNRLGFNVTQATVSRDINELGITKVAGEQKKYRYAQIKREEKQSLEKVVNMFRESVVYIKSAQNLVVVKTISGSGSAAGLTIDMLELDEMVGSVAGDDTLLIVCSDNASAENVVKKLSEIVNR